MELQKLVAQAIVKATPMYVKKRTAGCTSAKASHNIPCIFRRIKVLVTLNENVSFSAFESFTQPIQYR